MRSLGASGLSNSRRYPSAPTTYTLELTAQCNNRCVGCGNVFSREIQALNGEAWIELLEKLQPHICSLRVTGGEPTLHPDFPAIIRSVDSLDAPFVIFTNGRWQSSDELIRLLLKCANLDGLLVSLHGKDSESHGAFTGTDSFDETCENIKRATEAGLRVGTNAVITRRNLRDFEAIVTLALSLGAMSVAFGRYYGPVIPLTDITPSEFKEAVLKVIALRKQDRRVILNGCVPQCFSGVKSKACPSGVTHCTIGPTGNVRPCTHAPLVLGNLWEQSIEEIWDSEAIWQWRAMVPQQCYSCAAFADCGGGCRATAMQRGLDKDPLIRKPVSQREPRSEQKLRLYEEASPISNFRLREEAFGYLLVNRSEAVSVPHQAKPILDALDGSLTLRQIQQSFGQKALNFVGSLYKIGLVELS